MTHHLRLIRATIPPGDPSSNERMEWCKAAAQAIADTCYEHSNNQIEPKTEKERELVVIDAVSGTSAAFRHARIHLMKKVKN